MRSTMMGWNAAKQMCFGVIVVAILATIGCTWSDTPPADQMNSPPQGTASASSRMQETYVAMTDNALLNDASMSSVHFVPRTAELNAIGVRRLTRLAELLKVYGGTVAYDGTDPERDLRKDRVEKIRSFLITCGLAADRFNVDLGLAGGAGMDADEAVSVRKSTRGTGDILIYFEEGPPSWTGGHQSTGGGGGAGGATP